MQHEIKAPKAPSELFVKRGVAMDPKTYKGRKIFPLGEFSRFVVEEQPKLLAQVRDGHLDPATIVKKQDETLHLLTPTDIENVVGNLNRARTAMLDLSFAMSAAIFSGATPSEEAQRLNGLLAKKTGLPETMTFEKIVSINSKLPFEQMRTFTEGEMGETEKSFYYGHDLMDYKLRDATQAVAQSIQLIRTHEPEAVNVAIQLLSQAAGSMQEFVQFMRSFMEMPREHFGVFRQYLSQYPDGTRNASGAFIGMPRLHIRLDGVSPKYDQFLDEGMHYFPISEQPDIQEARKLAKDGIYLVALCESFVGSQKKELAKAAKAVIDQIREFRLAHLAAVSHHVPGALPEGLSGVRRRLSETTEEPILEDETGVLKGTGGFNVAALLGNCIRNDISATARLDAVINR